VRKQKTWLALFIAGVLMVNTLGYTLFSVCIITHKKWVFSRIETGVGEEEVVVLNAANIQDAKWENKREFEWNHQMYDVVSVNQVDGNLTYTCKKDEKEDDLKKQREKTSHKKMSAWVKIFVQDMQIFSPRFIPVPHVGWLREIPNHYSFLYSLLFHPPPLV
jgi:hypothetical protein